jgi:hypothetical protein
VHFLRLLVVWLLMAVLFHVIVGFVWMMFGLSATGRREPSSELRRCGGCAEVGVAEVAELEEAVIEGRVAQIGP